MSREFKKLGPTGKFPFGKIHESDEGELAVGIAIDKASGSIVINFGKEIRWVSLYPSQARELAQLLIDKANESDKLKS